MYLEFTNGCSVLIIPLKAGATSAGYGIKFPNLDGLNTFPLRNNRRAIGTWLIASNCNAYIQFCENIIFISGHAESGAVFSIHRDDYTNSEFTRIYNELVVYRDSH